MWKKERESNAGCDGTWVAHPDLVALAHEIFKQRLQGQPHQKHRLCPDAEVEAADLTNLLATGGQITEGGVRLNVSVALQYLNAWLLDNGAAAINNLMEDTATAEISRAQLWQWMRHGARLADGRVVDAALYRQIRDEELARLGGAGAGRYREAAEILDKLVFNPEFTEFLTFIAYDYLS